MRRQPGDLGDDRGVEVADLEVRGAHPLRHSFQDLTAVDARQGRIAGRKMGAEVTRTPRPEQGVGHRVKQRVPVGVAQKTRVIRNLDTSKN